jgi:HAD superfamily hydrolase (TIGR01548 family)
MAIAPNLIIFDMDGVLVDVTESYRAAIQCTVANFTGKQVTNETIQEYKNKGGFNDDWLLSQRLILDNGLNVRYQDVVDFFQSVFLGADNDGLIMKERWIAKSGHMEAFAKNATLAVCTGRMRAEAFITLNRYAPGLITDVVGVDDVINPKPAPEGLLKIVERNRYRKVWYVGDSVDDALAAREARIPFIGIAAKNSPSRKALVEILRHQGAFAVIEDINEMEPKLFA